MPGLFAVKLYQPDLTAPSGWNGLITQVYDATVTRRVNAAGSFTVTFPMAANEATSVKRGWKLDILQERIGAVKSDGTSFTPPALMIQGRVLRRTPLIDEAGGVMMQLEGDTFLGRLGDYWIQTEQTYTTRTLDQILTALITPLGVTYSVPARCAVDTLTVKFSDVTYLQALIRLAELTRTNLVDTFTNAIKFTDMDALPDPATNVNVDETVVRLVNVERAVPDSGNAAFQGFGIIAGAPTVSYDGSELANRLKVIGVDFDGNVLDLGGATGTDPKFAIQTGVGPSGNYYYVEDTTSQTTYGFTEAQIIRSDIKNPSDDAGTRAAAKTCLYAIACGELLRRRSEIFTMQVQVASEDIYALCGEKVRVRYSGKAYLPDRTVTVVNVDQWMVVTRRYDRASDGGVRLIGLDVSAPEIAYTIPSLPNAVPIPTPKEKQTPPEKHPTKDALSPDQTQDPTLEDPQTIDPGLLAALTDQLTAHGAYQPCCPDPMADVGGNGSDGGTGTGDAPVTRSGALAYAPGQEEIDTATPHGLTAGETVVISGVSGIVPSLNGTYQVLQVLSATQFVISYTYQSGAAVGGTVTRYSRGGVTAPVAGGVNIVDILAYAAGQEEIDTAGPHGFKVGDHVTVSGVTGLTPNFNGNYTVLVVPTSTSLVVSYTYSSGTATGDPLGKLESGK